METEYTQPQAEGVQLQKTKWYEPLTTVTTLSKTIATIVFIALPFIGFWYGVQYDKTVQDTAVEMPRVVGEQKASDDSDGAFSAEPKGGGPTETVVLPEGTRVTIDEESLTTPLGTFKITGTSVGVDTLGVGLVNIDGQSVFNAGPVQVVDGRWSVEVSRNIPSDVSATPLPKGVYGVTVFGPADVRLATGVATVGTTTSDPAKAVELMFVAEPSTVAPGESTTLFWRAPNAVSCEARGDWSGSKLIMGEEQTPRISSPQSYQLICEGSGRIVTKTVQVAPY